jgi:acetate kinase
MNEPDACILTINCGSSSIKFALYQIDGSLKQEFQGKVDRIGLPNTNLVFNNLGQNRESRYSIEASDHKSAANVLIDWLEEQTGFTSVRAVGHRVVHGMSHTEPEVVAQGLLNELHRISPYDPDHLPRELELIEVFRQRHPKLPQVACFDTAFHRTMPRVARLLPIPRRFDRMGIQRYGFHGLSYAFAAVLGRLETLVFAGGVGENAPEVRGRICDGLGFLGVELDEASNAINASVISAEASRVSVRVIPTNEELMIARSVFRLLYGETQAQRIEKVP